jgi:putative lipoic acid-binding regulatory protein
VPDNPPPLIEFPCRFDLKVMGAAAPGFELLVIGIVERHCGPIDEQSWRTRPSRNQRYLSVTVTVTARDQSHLDDLYRELSAHERILMVL